MKVIYLLISVMLLISSALADEVKIELNPVKPVAGEVFKAIFHIYTDADEEPVINFSPFRVEVVGKNNYGVKTSTTWINGKFSSTREMTYVYELATNTTGAAGLRDITVQVGGKTLKHPSLNFEVLKEAEQSPDVFVMADVPKKVIFLGEGIVVRYYLYSKVQVGNLDIKKYPKLNNFLKRFLQEAERTERVSVDGELYLRTQIYAAKLFPEKIGELKIDPLQLNATVFSSRGNDPFGAFGLNRDTRTKSVSSELIKVEVRPLPEEGKTAGFTGLVGKHDFNLGISSSKLIVNEPLELKLTVSGGGALENMDAPVIIKNPNLEEFETNGDLKIHDADQATKTFDYTFLPKANLNLPANTVTLTYFDPAQMKYIPVKLEIPEIIVAGGGAASAAIKDKPQPTKEKDEAKVSETENDYIPKNFSPPDFTVTAKWKGLLNYINFGLAIFAILFALGVVIRKDKLPKFSSSSIPASFKKGKFHLSEFAVWLTPLIAKTGKSPLGVIKDSDLSQETKSYFVDLLNSNDYKNYSHSKGQFNFVYKAEAFRELDKYILSVNNENSSQAS